uniref:Protein kinase domain-containing protein n=1 Tax=Nippostrongylus brasiliensis TaxID=27835 RepID=A0A158R3K9_NIPBR
LLISEYKFSVFTRDPINFPKESVVARRWRIRRKLGEGGFGAVYKAAMKVEQNRKNGVLKLEALILRTLDNYPFVPKLLDSGKKSLYSYIVITLLGPSLNKILKVFGKVCSVSTQVRIGINTLYAIKQLHDVGFLHRDLKPANMAVGTVGTPEFRFIHIFDFGLARRFIVPCEEGEAPKMRRPRNSVHFRGTLRYCSINCHERGELGRDDDLWCFLYMMVELRGPLPWANIRRAIYSKRSISFEELLKNCPVQFLGIAEHISTLNYYVRPNYALIYRLLKEVMDAGKIRDTTSTMSVHTDRSQGSSTPSSPCLTPALEFNPFPPEFFESDPLGF